MNKYLFTVSGGDIFDNHIRVDEFAMINYGAIKDQESFAVARQLQPDFGDKEAGIYSYMKMRTQYNHSHGHFLVKIDFDMGRDDLELYLNNIDKDELKQFLNEAKV